MRFSWQRTSAVLVVFVGWACLHETPKVFAEPSPDTKARITENYGNTPLSFEVNTGQTDKRVKFFSRGQGYGLYLSPTEAVMVLQHATGRSAMPTLTPEDELATTQDVVASSVLRMGLINANPHPKLAGEEAQLSKSNYLVGKDPRQWRMDIANYGKVRYEAVYKGIDLVYYGNQKKLEYDFIVQPGADYKKIRMQFKGADKVSIDDSGNLVLHTQSGDVVQHKPIVYQTENSRQEARDATTPAFGHSSLSGGKLTSPPLQGEDQGGDGQGGLASGPTGKYILLANNQVAFDVENYDPAKTLVIDPLIYSTYIGGSSVDRIYDIAVDSAGNAYLTGTVLSTDYPTTSGAYQAKFGGGSCDTFVTKLNSAGTAIVYSTYIGGSDVDIGHDIEVDSSGNAYVSGWTSSTNFPTTSGAYQSQYGGSSDAFVFKLNFSGTAIIYSTYIGGSGVDGALGIAVDSSGNAYVSGGTTSSNFPTTAGAYQAKLSGGGNIFMTKLNPTGTALVYSTYIGGSVGDGAHDMVVDSSGNAYMTGGTRSSNFPTTAGAYQTKFGGGDSDVFVTKLNATGTALVYSTYIGGSNVEVGDGIAVDSSGNTYVTGHAKSTSTTTPIGDEGMADSTGFPTTQGAYQTEYGGGSSDAFVFKLNSTGTALVYSTFLGGSGGDDGSGGVVVDSSGNAYITGSTNSANFPMTSGAYQSTLKGSINAFLAKLNSTGTGLAYSSYLGGSQVESGQAIALDSSGKVYVTGGASSTNFPTTSGAYQTKFSGFADSYVAKMALDVSPTSTVATLSCKSGTLYKASLSNGSTGSVCLSMKKVTTPSGDSKLRGTATTSWRGFAKSADSASGSTFTFAWENYESDPSSGILHENNPAQGALFVLAYAFPSSSCSGGASFFAVFEMPNAVSMTNFGSTINVTPLFGQICGAKITTLTQYTLTKQ